MRFWRASRVLLHISRRNFRQQSPLGGSGSLAAASVLGFSLFSQPQDSTGSNIYEDIKGSRYGEVYRRLKTGETASQGI